MEKEGVMGVGSVSGKGAEWILQGANCLHLPLVSVGVLPYRVILRERERHNNLTHRASELSFTYVTCFETRIGFSGCWRGKNPHLCKKSFMLIHSNPQVFTGC